MWLRIGKFILRFRFILLFLLLAVTGVMGYWASKMELSYDFARAIPTDNPKYQAYQEFRKKFGEDGNLLVIGIQTDSLFQQPVFQRYVQLQQDLKKVKGVEDVLSVPSAINLAKDSATEKLRAVPVFSNPPSSQAELDSSATVFQNLPFYRGLLYNPATHAFMMAVRINKDVLNSGKRVALVKQINKLADQFAADSHQEVYLSGLPLIRTELSVRIVGEMRWFLVVSVVLSALILLLFFRSVGSTLLSLAVVIMGVIWSLGTMYLFQYKITLLTGLIPPLLVVIGIPNCIYFLNKFHTAYGETGEKRKALETMVGKMGIVTLFCNLAAGIGFAVFALTRSQILKEFGVVAGINIMALFVISLILIPSILSLLPAPKSRHTKYLDNPRLNRWLDRLERWSLNHRKLIYIATVVIVAVSIVGIGRLKSVGYIVDDLPKSDRIYTDLKFFEKNFKGVMPLEIVVTTKSKAGIIRDLKALNKMDTLSGFIASMPELARPLSITEGLKFAKQAFFEGDTASYTMPGEFDLPAMAQYLKFRSDSGEEKNSFSKLVSTFVDSSRMESRISVSMADVGSKRLPEILTAIDNRANQLFPTALTACSLPAPALPSWKEAAISLTVLKKVLPGHFC